MSSIYVHIYKNGEEKIVEFLDTDSIDFVENKMRTGSQVTGGFLSSVQDRTVIVRSFIAGAHYCFRDYVIETNETYASQGELTDYNLSRSLML